MLLADDPRLLYLRESSLRKAALCTRAPSTNRDAGFTPAEALAAATIVPARLVGQDAHTGSIAVGKTADLVLVAGDPSQRIGDLRHTRVVMLDGKLLDADALRRAAGFSGRPKY
jgi:cytosine/adenosine deaminase-related metal-dependent hydrolase